MNLGGVLETWPFDCGSRLRALVAPQSMPVAGAEKQPSSPLTSSEGVYFL